jgi:hypothetical protein
VCVGTGVLYRCLICALYMYFRADNHNISPCVDDGQEKTNDDAPENNPQYTTVYVGNLAPEARICFFDSLSHSILSSIYIFKVVIILSVVDYPSLVLDHSLDHLMPCLPRH